MLTTVKGLIKETVHIATNIKHNFLSVPVYQTQSCLVAKDVNQGELEQKQFEGSIF